MWPFRGRRSWKKVSETHETRAAFRTAVAKRKDGQGQKKKGESQTILAEWLSALMPTRPASALSLTTIDILARTCDEMAWRIRDRYYSRNTAAHSLAGVSRLIPMTGLPHTTSEAHRHLLSGPTDDMVDLLAFPSGLGEVS